MVRACDRIRACSRKVAVLPVKDGRFPVEAARIVKNLTSHRAISLTDPVSKDSESESLLHTDRVRAKSSRVTGLWGLRFVRIVRDGVEGINKILLPPEL